jgi:hypothetical protein
MLCAAAIEAATFGSQGTHPFRCRASRETSYYRGKASRTSSGAKSLSLLCLFICRSQVMFRILLNITSPVAASTWYTAIARCTGSTTTSVFRTSPGTRCDCKCGPPAAPVGSATVGSEGSCAVPGESIASSNAITVKPTVNREGANRDPGNMVRSFRKGKFSGPGEFLHSKNHRPGFKLNPGRDKTWDQTRTAGRRKSGPTRVSVLFVGHWGVYKPPLDCHNGGSPFDIGQWSVVCCKN